VRRNALLVVVVILASVLGACGGETVAGEGRNERGAAVESAGAGGFDWSEDNWEVIVAPPDGVTGQAPVVWTGEEFIVWGTPAAAFRPAGRTWRSLPPAPIGDRRGMVAVWTGSEVVYWGGGAPEGGGEFFSDGAAYNPNSNSWRLIAPSPLPARSGAVADMVAGAMVVWGGITRCCPIDSVIHDPSAARYDPVTDSWSRLGDVPEPWSGDDGQEVTLIAHDSLYVFRRQQLGQYDAVADEWRELPRPDVPRSQCWMTGGPVAIAEASRSTIFTWSGGCAAEHGLAFDMAAGQWRPTAKAPPGGTAWSSSSASGDGAVFLITASTHEPEGAFAVHAYLVADDRWVDLPRMPEGAIGSGAQLVWTGSELFAWGGWRQSGPVVGGVVYSTD